MRDVAVDRAVVTGAVDFAQQRLQTYKHTCILTHGSPRPPQLGGDKGD
jgi:hypothetical protein